MKDTRFIDEVIQVMCTTSFDLWLRKLIAGLDWRERGLAVQDAEDARQEIVIKALNGEKTFETGREVRPWLYTLARNHVNRSFGRRSRALKREAASENPERYLAGVDGAEAAKARGDADVAKLEWQLDTIQIGPTMHRVIESWITGFWVDWLPVDAAIAAAETMIRVTQYTTQIAKSRQGNDSDAAQPSGAEIASALLPTIGGINEYTVQSIAEAQAQAEAELVARFKLCALKDVGQFLIDNGHGKVKPHTKQSIVSRFFLGGCVGGGMTKQERTQEGKRASNATALYWPKIKAGLCPKDILFESMVVGNPVVPDDDLSAGV